jgi:adenylate cyclase
MRAFHYRWEWLLPATPEALWPLLSDTNRFNRDTGVPFVEALGERETASRNGRKMLRLRRLGVVVEWEEMPFEWARPSRFGVARTYTRGPVAEMRVLAEMSPAGENATKLVYQVWATPRNAIGLAAIPFQVGVLSARRFDEVFRRYGTIAAAAQAYVPFVPPAGSRADLVPGGAHRLGSLAQKLLDRGMAGDLVRMLVSLLRDADDMTAARMRPYELADNWGVPRRAVLELCLHAARDGMLDMQWELLCPLCRGAQETAGSLRDIQSAVHCPSCNIDFTINFDESVELTFRPNPAIRHVDTSPFCMGGPQLTPHIVLQQLLAPGEERDVSAALEQGRYRFRTLTSIGNTHLIASDDGEASPVLNVGDDGPAARELNIALRPVLHLVNRTPAEQLMILERTAWSDQSATAAEVTVLQGFRDLFSSEALRQGEHISVGSLAVLFTDLRDSTRLYRDIGDAPAFGRVMSHFDLLRGAIDREGGNIVKTIGDAVMAVFRRPAGAVRAMLEVQQQLATPVGDADPLVLKAGLHYGPCIAVTMNDRLDYFGSTVNIAARLDALSSGGEVVISDAIACDPEVMALMLEEGITAEPFDAKLKGFDSESFRLWRIAKRDS